MIKRQQEIITLVLVVGIVIFTSLNTVRFFGRTDMTSAKVFTISEVSKNLFQSIPEKVRITYYISERLKKVSPFPGQIEDMLHEYASYSRGKISIDIIDPDKQGIAAQLERLGIYPQQIEVIEKNEQSFAMVYSALVIEHLGSFEVLPFVLRTETLEYDLTSAIKGMLNEEEKTLAVIIGDASRSLKEDYNYLYKQLLSKYRVEEIPQGEDIPPGIEALIVLGNRDLDDFDLYPIDQWLMRGGRALFCVEGVYVDLENNLEAVPLTGSPLLDMLKQYGVTVRNELVLDEVARDFRIPQQIFGKMAWRILGKYPHWIAVISQNVSKEHIITSRFAGVDLLWPSPLEINAGDKIKSTVLLSTSPQAWLMKEPFQTNPYNAEMLLAMRGDTIGQYPLACSLEGQFTSYFKGKPVPKREGESRNWGDPIGESDTTNIIVLGDTDFASNLIQYSDSGYNMVFLDNIADWLSNEDDMLQIKTRQLRDTRLNRIQDPLKRERTYMFAQVLNLVIIPAIVILFGIQRFMSRRKRTIHEGEEN